MMPLPALHEKSVGVAGVQRAGCPLSRDEGDYWQEACALPGGVQGLVPLP